MVFLCGLSRDFNRENLRAQVLCDKELYLGLSVADTANRVRYPAISKRAIVTKSAAESLSEEMRVLYVAMTRARDRLIMTYASRNLQDELQDIALRYDIGGPELLTRDVVCPGEWVLLSALRRTEAGAFHNLGGRPQETHSSDYPWMIRVVQAPASEAEAAAEEISREKLPDELLLRMKESLAFRYAHIAATQAPSKQTATQRKGRPKDSEAAEAAEEPKQIRRNWRKPAFAGSSASGKTYGNAVHSAMQYVRYSDCGSVGEIQKEIDRLVQQKFLTPDQGSMVDCEALYGFFASEIGQKLRSGCDHIREFKFSILDDGSNYGDGLEGEQVLLQGVVDCALMEEDGITVVDFKTDHVTEETLSRLTEHYRSQVSTYAQALSRIYRKKIKGAYLYFFRLNRFVQV